MAVVMQHLGTFSTRQPQFHHELATIADAKRKGVFAGVEAVEGLLGLRVIEEGTCPALGRA